MSALPYTSTNEAISLQEPFMANLDSPLTLLLLILPALPNLWCIWHAYVHEFPKQEERLAWLLAGIFLPVLGGTLYLLFGWRRSTKPQPPTETQTP